MRVLVLGGVNLNGGDAAINEAQRVILQSKWQGAEVITSDKDPAAAQPYVGSQPLIATYYDTMVGRRLAGTPLRRIRRLFSVYRRLLELRAVLAAWSLAHGHGWFVTGFMSHAEMHHLRTMLAADLVVYCGGTSLTQNYDVRPKLFDIDLARILNKPYVFMQQSIGPFQGSGHGPKLRKLLAASSLVLLRDERSLGHVVELGVPAGKCRVLPDTVFAMASSSRLEAAAPSTIPTRVAVSVREWKFFESRDAQDGMQNYMNSVSALVTQLVRIHECDVVFVSTCQGRPEYWTDDSLTALKILERLPKDVARKVVVDREARSATSLVEFLSSFHIVVSTRLHAAILGVCAGVPTYAIAYEYKSHEVWRQLGLEHFVMDIEEVAPNALIGGVEALLADQEAVRALLRAHVPDLRDRAFSAATAISQALAAPTTSLSRDE